MPAIDHTTVDQIDSLWKANQSGPRGHLGCSQIGQSCARALWYSFHWSLTIEHEGRLLRLFQFGHDFEETVHKLFRSVGCRTQAVDDDTGRQFQCHFLGGHFSGSSDGTIEGLIEAPGTRHLLEIKTSADKPFKDLQKKGVEASKPVHYFQMQIYMHAFKLTRAYYIAFNKNTHEFYSERVKYDKDIAASILEKAEMIIESKEPPGKLSERPDWFECKWCDYKNICHHEEIPEVNCRTCLHSTPVVDESTEAKWHCNFHKGDIPLDFQRKGCDKHLFNPTLVPFDVVDASTEKNQVVYFHKGQKFANGPKGENCFPSHEFRNVRGSIIDDPTLNKLSDAFGSLKPVGISRIEK